MNVALAAELRANCGVLGVPMSVGQEIENVLDFEPGSLVLGG